VAARVQQAAVVVLAVELDQRLGEAAQHLARGAAVVDPGGLAAVGRVHPAQDQLVLAAAIPASASSSAPGMAGESSEHRLDLALRGARAHQFRPAAPAQHETQRIEQDRLARPVSPVSTLRPGWNSSSSRSISSMSLIARCGASPPAPVARSQSHSPRMVWR
jgi:hypothetical protein